MISASVEDYQFDAETAAHKRVDLKHIFGINCNRVPSATVHVIYDMQYVIHRENLPKGMKQWLEGLVKALDYGNEDIRNMLESALSAARKNTVHSHDSAELYD